MSEKENSALHIWGAASLYIKDKLEKSSYEQWFQSITPLELRDDSTIVLGISDDFFALCMKNNFSDLIEEAFLATCGRNYELAFEYGYTQNDSEEEKEDGELCKEDIPSDPGLCRATLKSVSQALTPSSPLVAPNCNSRYTFENFVVGEENKYAYSAALGVTENPGAVFNPLYIYGGTGMGKTHLIQAVANEMLRRNPNAVIRYTTCEGFLNAYSDSLRNKKHFEFREKFRKVDLLLVDDVHQLSGKEALQEEFFNTFNTLFNSGKQIILTSDKQPSEIPGLEKRLVTRFQSGLTTQITTPTFETRLAILQQKQSIFKMKLADDILTYIAKRISSSIRALEGALQRLTIFSSLNGNQLIDLSHAENLLSDLMDKEAEDRKVSVDAIQRTVADYFGLKIQDILGAKRPKNVAEPRMIAMYLSRQMTPHSLPEIGTMFGKTHATVIHAVKKIEEDLEKDETLRRTVSTLKRQLQN